METSERLRTRLSISAINGETKPRTTPDGVSARKIASLDDTFVGAWMVIGEQMAESRGHPSWFSTQRIERDDLRMKSCIDLISSC